MSVSAFVSLIGWGLIQVPAPPGMEWLKLTGAPLVAGALVFVMRLFLRDREKAQEAFLAAIKNAQDHLDVVSANCHEVQRESNEANRAVAGVLAKVEQSSEQMLAELRDLRKERGAAR